jgi:hypothetical protein
VNIIETMADPELFEPWFRGRSWDPWRTVLKGAFALPLSKAEQALFRELAGRKPPKRPVRELWIVAGRRSGKDSVASLIAAHVASFFDSRGRLRRGEKATVMCLACDKEQARIVLGYVKSYFTEIQYLKALVERETVNGLQLSNGVDIVVATDDYRAVRGRAVALGIFDELAFWKSENSSSPDTEVYNAIKPGTMTVGGMIVGISSPHKKSGLLHEKWRDHYAKDGDVLVVHAPSRALNPTLDPKQIAAEIERDPAVGHAEWLAQWRDDLAGYVPLELIECAVDRGVAVRPPRPGVRYLGFIDAASGTGKDSFAVGIAHAEGDKVFLDVAHEIRPPFNPSRATEHAAALLKSYRIHTVTGDKYAAGYNMDAFRRCGISYQYSERDRSEIYCECLPLFTSGRLRLVDSKRLIAQFATLERRTSAAGRDRVDHGHGDAHDDLSNAAAGAAIAASGPQAIDWAAVGPALIAEIRAHPYRRPPFRERFYR